MSGAQDCEVEVMEYPHYSLAYAGNAFACKEVIKRTLDYFNRNSGASFDFIACAGNSGLALGSILSYLMDKPMWHMRNSTATRLSTEESKDVVKRVMSCNQYYGDDITKGQHATTLLKGQRYLFIDDLIESGKTFRRVHKALESKGAICLYISVNYGNLQSKDIPASKPIFV